jgi:hypothetical protein
MLDAVRGAIAIIELGAGADTEGGKERKRGQGRKRTGGGV